MFGKKKFDQNWELKMIANRTSEVVRLIEIKKQKAEDAELLESAKKELVKLEAELAA